MLERDCGGVRQLSMRFEGIAEQRAEFQRHRFDAAFARGSQQSKGTEHTRETRRFE
jgi:hypothetical protein